MTLSSLGPSVGTQASAEATLVTSGSASDDAGANGGAKPRVLARGATIGRYVVLGPIGAGAMGTVVAAYDPELDRKIAIKLLHAHGDDDAATLRREAQTLARLNHPNVVTVYDVGLFGELPDRRVFLAMEFVDGTTLRRWWKAQPRSPTEIVRAFLQAGRGLAAAHRAGVVHRDFKPDNVLVANDAHGAHQGRVCVADFGVAEHDDVTTGNAMPKSAAESRRSLPIGTPAYMAPEQLLGSGVDARADQYAFCVSLFEALAGARPFDDPVLEGIADARRELRRDTPRPVPAKVLRVVQRGLEREPERRFASMDALLQALEKATRGRRNAWLVGTGAVVLATSTWALARWTDRDGAQSCDSAAERLAGTWDDNARARVQQAFAASPAPYSATAFDRAAAGLDAWTDVWVVDHREACEATHVHGQQTARELDLRTACLDGQLRYVGVVADLLATGELDIVQRSAELVASLPDHERCRDVARLDREPATPSDPEIAMCAAAVESGIGEVKALHYAGRERQGLERAREVHASAERCGHEPTLARAEYWLANQHHMMDEFAESDRRQHLAFESALAVGDDDLMANAAIALVAAQREFGRWDEGRSWGRIAAAALRRRGAETEDMGALEANLALLAMSAGRVDESLAHADRALELRRQLPPDDPRIGEALVNISATYRTAGRNARALEAARDALAHYERVVGIEHPNTLTAMNNMAILEHELGEVDAAFATMERVVQGRERLFTRDHPSVLEAMANLAALKYSAGRIDEARSLLHAALERLHAGSRRHRPLEAQMELILAALERDAGELEIAAAHSERFVELARSPAMDTVFRGTGLLTHADIALHRGRLDEAEATLHEALRLLEPVGATNERVLNVRATLAVVYARQGRRAEAVAEIDEVLRQLDRSGSAEVTVAEIRFEAARVLEDADPARARELANDARAVFERLGQGLWVRKADAWLAEHGD